MNAKTQHEPFLVLNRYEEIYLDIEYSQLITDVACIITIYLTFYCYTVTRLIINSKLEY